MACKKYLRIPVDLISLPGGEACIDLLWDEIPEEWLHDSFGDRRSGVDKGGLKAILSSPRSDPGFWSLPTASVP